MRWRRRSFAALALVAGNPTDAWPSDLLKHDCAKGRELVAGGLTPPPIMGAIPELDLSLLRLRRPANDTDEQEGDEYDGRALQAGDSLELSYYNPRHKPLGVHLVFAASSGLIAGGQPCGPDGAVLQYTMDR